MTMLLPDVNVWLALAFGAHVHHAAAKAWFNGLSGEVCLFCRLTQQGFLRLATNPKAFGQDAVTLDQAWNLYDLFLGDSRVAYAEEPPGIEPYWRNYTQKESFSPKVWNDAFLAAFAQAATLRLITFDKAFAQYASLTYTVLS